MSLNYKNQNAKSKSIELYKRMLLSRDTNEQMKAVNSICQILKYYESDFEIYNSLIDWLLINDICVFLCEASATLHIHLLRLILNCFEKFSSTPSFYVKSHSPHVVTCIVRTIQFLVKENGSENVIHELLSFVSNVIITSKTYKTPSIVSRESVYNVIQIFELLFVILDKTSYETKTKISIAYLLHNIIEKVPNKTIITTKALTYAKETIHKCLNSLNQILVVSKYKSSADTMIELVFQLICQICTDTLYLCDKCETITVKMSKEIVRQNDCHKSFMKDVVYSIVFEITAQMKEFELFVLKPNIDIFLELLNEFLNQQDVSKDKLSSFAQHLCSHGFLAFLGQLVPVSIHTRKLCLMNLAEILSILSLKVFEGDCSNGGENYKTYFFEGFMEIGFNYKLWPQKLNDKLSSNSTIYSLISYIYFNCLYSESPEMIVSPLLPHLVEFILQLPKKKVCPDPILKCLWLIFSIASISNKDHRSIHGGVLRLHRAISTMSNMLLFKVKKAYTHHPYIIMWSFSSHRISTIVQNQVLSMWFEKESTLPKNLADNSAVWNSLLNIIVIGEEQTSLSVMKDLLMESIQEYSEEDDPIRHVLWNTLAQLLKKLSIGSHINMQSLLCVIELCNSCPPELPQLNTIQRTASLLPTLLIASKKYNINLENHFIKEAYIILINSLKHEDKLVLTQYINTPIFLQTIFYGTSSEDVMVATLAYEILSTCLYYKSQFNIVCPNFIKMDPTILVTTLRGEKSSQKITSVLTLIHQTLKIGKNDLNSFIILATIHPKETFINTYKALFFRLQMMCCKDLRDESLISWYCLNSLLEFASIRNDIPELITTIIAQPWTHKLIHFYLYQNQLTKCHTKFLRFVFNWLTCHKTVMGKSETKIDAKQVFKPQAESNIMFITLSKIINEFSNETLQSELVEEKRNIVHSVLNLISEILI